MNDDTPSLDDKIDRLRLDLMATNQALMAIAAAMPPKQLQSVLTMLAKASARKQETFERIPLPALQAALLQQREAEDRLYQGLQGAPKLFRES
jgi:hypothetical protein